MKGAGENRVECHLAPLPSGLKTFLLKTALRSLWFVNQWLTFFFLNIYQIFLKLVCKPPFPSLTL